MVTEFADEAVIGLKAIAKENSNQETSSKEALRDDSGRGFGLKEDVGVVGTIEGSAIKTVPKVDEGSGNDSPSRSTKGDVEVTITGEVVVLGSVTSTGKLDVPSWG
ncbi:hypothetical protein ACLOJK_023820 [Asimina triloba]